MKKFVLSGPPHAGKSTLLELFAQTVPKVYCVPEAALMVIKSEYKKQEEDPNYLPRIPWNGDYGSFSLLCAQKSIELESKIPEGIETALMDRGIVDNIAFSRLHGVKVPKNLFKQVEAAQYDVVIFCDLVGDYASSKVRGESLDEAKKVRDLLIEAYAYFGIEALFLPAMELRPRLEELKKLMGIEVSELVGDVQVSI